MARQAWYTVHTLSCGLFDSHRVRSNLVPLSHLPPDPEGSVYFCRRRNCNLSYRRGNLGTSRWAYVDRKGRRKVFVGGTWSHCNPESSVGLSNNLLLVGGAHGLEGLAAAMVTVASLTMITDLTVVTNRGVGMADLTLPNLGGYGVGIVLGRCV